MSDKNKKEETQDEEQIDNAQELDFDSADSNALSVSKKSIIYAEIDDEVNVLHDKIAQLKTKNIYIVVPKRAVLFQSLINLKILKKRAEEEKKQIYFITNDTNGVNLANKVGITVYDKVNQGDKPSLFSSEEDDHLKITPLRATVNSVEEQAPTKLSVKKLSISELLKNPVIIKQNRKSTAEKDNSINKIKIVTPNKGALFMLVSSVFIILMIVFYIALPGVTIYLTPAASVLEKSVNITLADYNKNKAELETHPHHMIASYPIEVTIEKTYTHFTAGKKFSDKGANATGKLTIINTSSAAWPLIPRTRFQTEDGIVFRVATYVNVPAADTSGPGRLEVSVVADEIDAYGEVAGERGNIGPSRFILPGLDVETQKVLYAESSGNMAGGVTDYISYVSEADIEGAKLKLGELLVDEAIVALSAEVDKRSDENQNQVTFVLLDGEGAMKIGDPNIFVAGDLIGKEIESFEVSGSISVSGLYYDRDAMLEILKGELKLKKSPQKELLRINEDSTSYRIFNWDIVNGKVKLTANIKGIEQFDIDPDSENGQRLLQKIREHVAGEDTEDAKQYIQNLTEINKVEIDSWPAWAPTIPTLLENIDFEVREAITVQ